MDLVVNLMDILWMSECSDVFNTTVVAQLLMRDVYQYICSLV